MGTNYFLSQPACDSCGRPAARHHICKSLVTFRGHSDADHPLGRIRSWVDWETVLRYYCTNLGWWIVDDHGAEHDVDDFIESVEATSRVDRRRQYDWMQDEPPPARADDWLDGDGFSFYGRDFQ